MNAVLFLATMLASQFALAVDFKCVIDDKVRHVRLPDVSFSASIDDPDMVPHIDYPEGTMLKSH
ncbi:MAG: hypothetical protein HRT45_14315 [Bdellovibrionales bacterium]|nr:hypothetical protein [Bdellovibrionales bacterium]